MTPAGRGPGAKRVAAEAEHSGESTEPEQRTEHASIGCTLKGMKAQRLRRVFGIDIERCATCGGTLRIIACIEDRTVIEKILAHRRRIHALQGTSHCASGAGEARTRRA